MKHLLGYTIVEHDPDINYVHIDYEWLNEYLEQPIYVYKTLVETYGGIYKHHLVHKWKNINDLNWVENFHNDLIKKENTSWEGLWDVMKYSDSETKTSIKCVFIEANVIPENMKIGYTFIFESLEIVELENDFTNEVIIYPTLKDAYNGCIKYINENIPWLNEEPSEWIDNIDKELYAREGTSFQKNWTIYNAGDDFKIHLKCAFII